MSEATTVDIAELAELRRKAAELDRRDAPPPAAGTKFPDGFDVRSDDGKILGGSQDQAKAFQLAKDHFLSTKVHAQVHKVGDKVAFPKGNQQGHVIDRVIYDTSQDPSLVA